MGHPGVRNWPRTQPLASRTGLLTCPHSGQRPAFTSLPQPPLPITYSHRYLPRDSDGPSHEGWCWAGRRVADDETRQALAFATPPPLVGWWGVRGASTLRPKPTSASTRSATHYLHDACDAFSWRMLACSLLPARWGCGWQSCTMLGRDPKPGLRIRSRSCAPDMHLGDVHGACRTDTWGRHSPGLFEQPAAQFRQGGRSSSCAKPLEHGRR